MYLHKVLFIHHPVRNGILNDHFAFSFDFMSLTTLFPFRPYGKIDLEWDS